MLYKTKQGTEVELKDFISGGDYLEIQKIYLSAMKMKDGNVESIDPIIAIDAQKATIGLIVLSVNGQGDDVIGKVLALPKAEFDEISAWVNEVTQGLEKKTNI